MRRLIVNGDADFRKDAVIEYDGEEYVVFQINRNGEWHGPDRVQLWCVVGGEDERDAFVARDYIPHWLDTELVDADAIEVVS